MNQTSNPASIVDAATFTVRRTIRVDAPVEKVWRAVTEPELIGKWFGRPELSGAGAGSTGTISWPGRHPIPLRVESVDEPRLVAYRWNNDDALGTAPDDLDESTSTVFTFTLEPVDGGTQLTVVETGFERTSDPAANMTSHAEGWTSELDKLVVLAETAS
jgi:uncharacterized protein YndB with AHSA1/START domain